MLNLWFLCLYLLSSAGGWGIGVVVCSSHVVCATPSSSEGGILTLFPSSSVGSIPWETVLHKLLQHEIFPWAADIHGVHKPEFMIIILSKLGSYSQAHFIPTPDISVPLNYGLLSPNAVQCPNFLKARTLTWLFQYEALINCCIQGPWLQPLVFKILTR